MQTAPYGTWKSPISSDLIVAETIGLAQPFWWQGDLCWTESRPGEGGRNVLVRQTADGQKTDLTPPPFNVRTRVHEYGGGACWFDDQVICFCHFDDQQIYLIDTAGNISQLTQAPELRFANGLIDRSGNRIIAVVERHETEDQSPDNYLAAIDLSTGECHELTAGHDFYSSPVLSPDGNTLAFITWDHPNMPWDGTTLWELDLNSMALAAVCGGTDEAVMQPQYDNEGRLHFISDRSGWWNLYRRDGGQQTNLLPAESDLGGPHWVFGLRDYWLQDDRIILSYTEHGETKLIELNPDSDTIVALPVTDSQISGLYVKGPLIAWVGASPTSFPCIRTMNTETGNTQTVRSVSSLTFSPADISVPRLITYPTADGDVAHGYYYPPANKEFCGPESEKPPLMIALHGGPTSAASTELRLPRQYWTSRGFAVFDIDYRGSSGYGRAYREKLKLRWGIADVEDCVWGVRHLISEGLADPDRVTIRGGSAGGYTTLAALAFTDTFSAGASHYGIGDLMTLATDTHKFESRYLDSLIGPYPEQEAEYKARSPINHIDKLACPVIFFQGLEDKVVPPNQAEAMVAALANKGIPVAYVPFEGEQHGFRKADNIKRALDLEFWFYSRIFGFEPADKIAPVEIRNLPT
ncbi:MAG: S9 family peptidase [Pseudomonadales bacterium]|nr:S9 family peptidase [Pseudomonadales bacterium]